MEDEKEVQKDEAKGEEPKEEVKAEETVAEEPAEEEKKEEGQESSAKTPEVKTKKTDWFVIILIVLIVALLVALFLVMRSSSSSSTGDTAASPSVSASVTATATIPASATTTASTTASPAASASTTSADSANITAVNKVLTDFLNAKQSRSLAAATPFMTADLAGSYSQESFAGVSSPTMSRFEITATSATTVGKTYTANARVYQSLNGSEVGYSDNTYEIVKSGTSFLVNNITEGPFVEK